MKPMRSWSTTLQMLEFLKISKKSKYTSTFNKQSKIDREREFEESRLESSISTLQYEIATLKSDLEKSTSKIISLEQSVAISSKKSKKLELQNLQFQDKQRQLEDEHETMLKFFEDKIEDMEVELHISKHSDESLLVILLSNVLRILSNLRILEAIIL